MGVDSDFYLKGSWTDEQKKAFEEAAKDRGLWGDYGKLTEYENGQWLYFHSLSRYYGVGYERGHWPYIHSIFALLKHYFPDAQLYYGGDSEPDECEEMTEEAISKLWAHWLSPDGERYWKKSNRIDNSAKPEIVDEKLEVIALEILNDSESDPMPARWVMGVQVDDRTKEELDAYDLGWNRKKYRDAKIVRTNGLSDERNSHA